MLIQLTTNLVLKTVSACSKTVVKGSAHLFPNSDENLNLVYKSEVGIFKFNLVLFETSTGKSCLILPYPSLDLQP